MGKSTFFNILKNVLFVIVINILGCKEVALTTASQLLKTYKV